MNNKLTVPTCKFYASTSRFLERIKTLLSTITRPTKRGKLFHNFKPRKPILSRHFKLVHIHFDIPKLNIIYWSSASEEFGCLLECEHFNLDSTHKLELIPFFDTLKRRPRPAWCIEIMKCKLAQTKTYLMAPNISSVKFSSELLKGSSGMNIENGGKFFDGNLGMKSFFMQIDSIFYEREKSHSNYNFYNCNYNLSAENYGNQSSFNHMDKFEIGSNHFKRVSTKRKKRISSKNNFDTSSSSSENHIITSKSNNRTKYRNYHSVKQPLNKLSYENQKHKNQQRSSLRAKIKKQDNKDYYYDYRPKSYSLLIGGKSTLKHQQPLLYHTNKERIGSADSLTEKIQPNTGKSTLTNVSLTSLIPFQVTNMPKHNIQVRNLKAKWNNVNRDVIYILYEIYNKAKRLRHNLSTQALKQYDVLTDQIVQSFANNTQTTQLRQKQSLNYNLNNSTNSTMKKTSLNTGINQKQPQQQQPLLSNNLNNLKKTENTDKIPKYRKSVSGNEGGDFDPQKQFFDELLNKLDAERGINSDIYCDEQPDYKESSNYNDLLYGVHAASKMSDIVNEYIFIEFINSQVKLSLDEDSTNSGNSNRGSNPNPGSGKNCKNDKKKSQKEETSYDKDFDQNNQKNEYLIISAAKANVIQRVHKPVWKSQRLLDKTSWSGNLETMQYFATLNYFNPPKQRRQESQQSDASAATAPNVDVEKQRSDFSGNPLPTAYAASSFVNNTDEEKRFKVSSNNLIEDDDEYWLTDEIIDAQSISSSPLIQLSESSQTPLKSNMKQRGISNEYDNLSDLSDPSLFNENNDVTSSSSSNNLNKINKNKNNLGMLITYKNTRQQPIKTKNQTESTTTDQENIDNKPQPQKKRFQNIRNGLITLKSNRKLQKPNLHNAEEPLKNPITSSYESDRSNLKRPSHLQLIVSKCRCEFYMIDFEDKIGDDDDHLSTNLITNGLSSSSPTQLNYSQIFPNFNSQTKKNKTTTNDLPSSQQIDLNATFNEPMDCISLIHYDLNLCTNSQQYKMIMNLVNNLVLYFRPRRKEIIDKQKSIKFNLQLSSSGDLDSLVKHIKLKQIEAKELLCNIRALERKLYHLREKIQVDMNDYSSKYGAGNFVNAQIYAVQELKLENKSMEKEYREFKKQLNELSDELNISISCYKELMLEKRAFNLANTPQFVQHVLCTIKKQENNNASNNNGGNQSSLYLSTNQSFYYSPLNLGQDLNLSTSNLYLSKLINNSIQQTHLIEKAQSNKENKDNEPLKCDLDQQAQQSILNNEIGRRYEIWFKQTRWQLNDDAGQKCCAQFLMKNILYTKVSGNQQELDCVEHTLEIESCKVQDLSSELSDKIISNKSTSVGTTPLKRSESKSKKNNNSKQINSFVLKGLFDNFTNYENSVVTNTENNENEFSQENGLAINQNNGTMIRVYFKERPPVGCIPVIDHLELNVSPLSINLTNSFFKLMMKFFFNNQANSTNQGNTANNMSSSNINSHNMANNNCKNDSSSNLIGNNSKINNDRLQIPNTRSANSTLKRNYKSFHGFNNEEYGGSNINNQHISSLTTDLQSLDQPTTVTTSKANNQNNIQIVLQSPQTTNYLNLLNKKPSQSSLLLNSETSENESPVNSNNVTENILKNDDIEIMKQRSANNNTFLCIKIPEIQLLVSYRATNKDKNNIKDLKNVSLLFPLFEVHDKTWTWLDLINALKSHVKKALVSQALRHKLIKVPIQPVNKFLNRVGRSQSSQHLTNLEIDENEKLTILKLFGTKFIEKTRTSNHIIPMTLNVSGDQLDSLERRNSFTTTGVKNKDNLDQNEDKMSHKSLMIMPVESKVYSRSAKVEKTHPKVTKSNSTLSFNLKKRFLEFTKDKDGPQKSNRNELGSDNTKI